jgi:two-component system copper resistance phosphate regulon response regulator CusR
MENVTNILLIEDDPKLGDTLSTKLREQGYTVDLAYDGMIAGRMFKQSKYDIIALDINVPHKNGLVLCEEFRRIDSTVPIIMITAFADIKDKLDAFGLGADDYIVKPFHFGELLARIKVFLRRTDGDAFVEPNAIIQVGDLTIDNVKKIVKRGNDSIILTAREFSLISLLAQEPGKVYSKNEIASKIWGVNFDTGTNTIEVYINFLRNKIDRIYPHKLIHTRSGFGYYLKLP